MTNDQDIYDLIRDGRTIEAIKRYRERYGVGLAEAKSAVEHMRDGQPATNDSQALARREPGDLVSIKDLVLRGNKIQAIKLYREQTGVGLREAKAAIEQMARESGHTTFGKDSRCFIATAAFGSDMAPEVAALRRWRDTRLQPSAFGRAIIRTYYRISPPIARWVEGDERTRALVRRAIRLFVSR